MISKLPPPTPSPDRNPKNALITKLMRTDILNHSTEECIRKPDEAKSVEFSREILPKQFRPMSLLRGMAIRLEQEAWKTGTEEPLSKCTTAASHQGSTERAHPPLLCRAAKAVGSTQARRRNRALRLWLLRQTRK